MLEKYQLISEKKCIAILFGNVEAENGRPFSEVM